MYNLKQPFKKTVLSLTEKGYILTIYSKITITIITKLLRWDHRVIRNVPAKFQSRRSNGLGGVALQRNKIIILKIMFLI